MLRLSIEALESFKDIYKLECGDDLNDEDANKLGIELLVFVSLIYKEIPVTDVPNVISYFDTLTGFSSLERAMKK